MPELIEVEYYRRALDPLVGRRIERVRAPDDWFLKGVDADEVRHALEGQRILGTDRRGKLALVHTTGATLGLRFGMTGVVEVDGDRPVEQLRYSSARRDPAWVRFALELDRGSVAIVDPRRLGGVELDPDLDRLGPDATRVTPSELRAALGAAPVAVKARLLDQHRLAGVGNLIADEVLWRASLAPARPADSLSPADHRRLHRQLRATVDQLTERGGSHTGDLIDHRRPGGCCPRDGEPLMHGVVGGRSTWWCPRHQA